MACSSISSLLSPRPLSPPSLFFLSPRPHKLRLLTPAPSLSSPPLSSSSSRVKKLSVSIAPVEQAPSPEFDFAGEISRLDSLRSKLDGAKTLKEKVLILDSEARVRDFLRSRKGWVSRVLGKLERPEAVLIKCLIAAGQEHVLGAAAERGGLTEGSVLKRAMQVLGDMVEGWSLDGERASRESGGDEEMRNLLKTLGEVEQFYDCIGGIIG